MLNLSELELGWVAGFFEAKGSYCKAGDKNDNFALEAFASRPDALEQLKFLVGGNVMAPPPAAPSRWTWRLYGEAARDLFWQLKPYLSEPIVARGEAKLAECRGH